MHCDGCVAYHTKMVHSHGAARVEVAESVAFAPYMGGHEITLGDRFGASAPSSAVSVSWKSPVEMPRR